MATESADASEATETIATIPKPAGATRSCRNRQSIHINDANAPPCMHHPSGTLKYIWHTAYDHLLTGSANRKTTYAVLIGDEFKSQYDSLCSFVADELDRNRNVWIGLDLESKAAVAPKEHMRQKIIDHVGHLRRDKSWNHKDDNMYIDLALHVFIRDSHHHWMKRPEQSDSSQPGVIRTSSRPGVYPGSARGSNKRPRIGPPSAGQSRRYLTDPDTVGEGATLATAIDVDDEGDTEDIHRRSTIIDLEDQEEVNDIRRRYRESSETAAVDQAGNDTNLPQTTSLPRSHIGSLGPVSSTAPTQRLRQHLSQLESENRRLKSRNTSLESQLLKNQNEAAALRQDLDATHADAQSLLSDNANLGLALAEKVGIRHNSANAVRTDLAARTILTREVTGRLLENGEFVQRWFRGR